MPGTLNQARCGCLDTLEHLVEKTVKRSDTNKFLYVLNHLDATAQDDNAEQVFSQRGG